MKEKERRRDYYYYYFGLSMRMLCVMDQKTTTRTLPQKTKKTELLWNT